MQHSTKITLPLLLTLALLPGCANTVNQGLYEGIKRQNEVHKSPVERAMTPAPSYNNYRRDRERLKNPAEAGE